MLYDVHAHIDLYSNREDIISYIESNKIYTICMTNVPDLYIKYQRQYALLNHIRFALGLHPELVKQYHNQLPTFIDMLPAAKYIGEIGLDYSSSKSYEEKQLQQDVFEKIIQHCYQCCDPKILNIHSRNAANEVISIVNNYHGFVIMHWVSDNNVDIQRAVKLGYYFSVNSQMVDSVNSQKTISRIPSDRLLVETDAPFTKKFNTYYTIELLNYTIRRLSALLGMDPESMEALLYKNFRTLLQSTNQ